MFAPIAGARANLPGFLCHPPPCAIFSDRLVAPPPPTHNNNNDAWTCAMPFPFARKLDAADGPPRMRRHVVAPQWKQRVDNHLQTMGQQLGDGVRDRNNNAANTRGKALTRLWHLFGTTRRVGCA